jgi:hypothetical protein
VFVQSVGATKHVSLFSLPIAWTVTVLPFTASRVVPTVSCSIFNPLIDLLPMTCRWGSGPLFLARLTSFAKPMDCKITGGERRSYAHRATSKPVQL